MQKRITFLIAFLSCLFVLNGCSSVDSDAKQLADLTCESMRLLKQAASGDMSVLQKGQELTKQAEKLREELDKKYQTLEEKKEFLEALSKHLQKCL